MLRQRLHLLLLALTVISSLLIWVHDATSLMLKRLDLVLLAGVRLLMFEAVWLLLGNAIRLLLRRW